MRVSVPHNLAGGLAGSLAGGRADARWRFVCAWVGLTAAYLVLRLLNLREMPVFTDEATYARWAQMIAGDPWRNWFVSMQDAKLPLHYWLLALARPMFADPIFSARVVSVIFGAAAIPFLLLLGRELRRLPGEESAERAEFAAVAAAMVLACPLIAMGQRMAMAESLLVLEAVVLGWMSLKQARLGAFGLGQSMLLGLAWGAALITKQNVSYALWILPVAAWIVHSRRAGFVRHIAIATVIGLAIFVPMLLSDATHDLRTRVFYKPVFQNHTESVLATFTQNLTHLLSPKSASGPQWNPHDAARPLSDGWLYLYFTPPVLLLALIAPVALLWTSRWRPLAFLGVFAGAQIVPLLLTAHVFLPRYVIVGAVPLLLMAAYPVAGVLGICERQKQAVVRWAAALIVPLVLAWPLISTVRAAADWRSPTLAKCDVEQLVTKFSCGSSTQEAIEYLQALSQREPITVMTGSWVGLPNDQLWLMLQDNPNVQLYCFAVGGAPTQVVDAPPNTYVLSGELWGRGAYQATTLDPHRPIYFLMPTLRDAASREMKPLIPLTRFPPGTHLVTVFANTADAVTHEPLYVLQLLEIPRN